MEVKERIKNELAINWLKQENNLEEKNIHLHVTRVDRTSDRAMSIKILFNKQVVFKDDTSLSIGDYCGGEVNKSSNPVLIARLLILIRQTMELFVVKSSLFSLRHTLKSSLFILMLLSCSVSAMEQICGEFKSSSALKSGSFNSAVIDENRAFSRKNNITDPILCIYKFIANKNEKVYLKFNKFDIKSLAPE